MTRSTLRRSAHSLVLFASFLFAIPLLADAFWYSAMSETDSVRNATEVKILRHEVSERAEGTELKVSMKIKEGSAVVTLVDSAGKTRFEKTYRAGKGVTEETFSGKPGAWQVRIDFRGATGRYSVKLVDY